MGTSVLRTHRIRGFIATMSLFFVLEGASLAQTLHAVIVTDSTRSDLALGADESVKLIKTVGVGVARSTNVSYAQILISDESISASKISRAVEGLKVTRDDVVFFYYFGHGLRSQSGGDLPALFVGPDASAALDANEILRKIREKRPRLTVMVVDACNRGSGFRRGGTTRVSALLPPVQENYKLLFERSAGEFVAMAARPGEFAYHFDEERNGGFFTYAFLAALKDIQSWGEGQIRLNKSITVNDGSDGTAPVYQNPLVKWREEPPNTDRGGDNVQEALVVPPRIPAERRLVPTTTNLCGKLISFEKYDSSPSGGFEGVWTGRWDGVGSGICGAFIVESTSADGKAKIIYSYAGSTGVQGEFRQSASVNGDTLEFTERDDGHYRFVLNGNRLFAYFTSSKGRSLRTEFFRQ